MRVLGKGERSTAGLGGATSSSGMRLDLAADAEPSSGKATSDDRIRARYAENPNVDLTTQVIARELARQGEALVLLGHERLGLTVLEVAGELIEEDGSD